MAFQANQLSVIAYANGFTLWHYTTTDADDAVDTAGYFDEASEILRAGDMILANTATAAVPRSGIFLVNAAGDGSVDVSDLQSVGRKTAVRVPFAISETDLLAGTSQYVVSPVAGNIVKAVTVAQKAVTTGGTITVEVGGVAVNGLAVSVADGAAAGEVDSGTPSSETHATTLVAPLGAIEIVPDASFATAGALAGYIEVMPLGDTD